MKLTLSSHQRYVHKCVFNIIPSFGKGIKKRVLWGSRDYFHVIFCKAQRDIKMDLERFSDVSYQGALYFLEGTKISETVKMF